MAGLEASLGGQCRAARRRSKSSSVRRMGKEEDEERKKKGGRRRERGEERREGMLHGAEGGKGRAGRGRREIERAKKPNTIIAI